MATTTYQFERSDFLARMAKAMQDVGLAARQAAIAFQGITAQVDPLWATLPGEWPDQFTLLNRYLRTGVKPLWLFNE